MDLAAPFRTMLDLALPPRCPGCGAIVGESHRFCAACWGDLRFLTPPWCAVCHRPFAYDRGTGARCADCLDADEGRAMIDAAVAYGPVARTLALRLKYGGRDAFAETAARLMERLVGPQITLLVPVPLHRTRLWSRGYNQAALIAAALARRCGIAHDPLVLVRRRATPVLRGLSAAQRRRAVSGAFAIDPARRAGLRGAIIGLVDDVYTSGATADAARRTLLRAGAAAVSVICWARVLHDDAD